MVFDTELVGKIGSMALIDKESNMLDYTLLARISRELKPGYTCMSAEDIENSKESYDVSVSGKDIIVKHFNIQAPKNTTMGIVDREGNLSFENKYNYYYLEAGDRFISFQEAFRESSSEEMCYYNLATRVTHISGGIYDFMIFNDKNELVYSKEVRIR